MSKPVKKLSSPPSSALVHRAQEVIRVIDSPPIASLDAINLDSIALNDDNQTMINAMVASLQTRNHEQAIDIVSNHLKKHPGNVAILNLLGALYLQADDLPRAEANLNLAHRLAPGDPLIVNNLSCLYSKRGNFIRAETILVKALASTQPTFTEFYYNLARANFGRGDHASAKASLAKAERCSDRPEITILKAIMASIAGTPDDALPLLLAGSQKFPNAHALSYYIAVFLLMKGQAEEASHYAMAALNAVPHNIYYAMMYCTVAQHINFSGYDTNHATAILNALACPNANHAYLTRPWTTLVQCMPFWGPLIANYKTFDPKTAHALIDSVQSDPHLLSPIIQNGLAKLFTRSPEWELILTAVRSAYVEIMDRNIRSLNDTDHLFLSLIATQIEYTEYAYYTSTKDAEICLRLQTRIAESSTRGNDISLLLLLMCFNKITAYLTENECLKYKDHPLLASIITTQVISPRRERDIMAKLPILTPIHDDISKLVEQMYMENPYPAWTTTNYSGNPKYLQLAPNKKDRIQALVAGCGTGQHSVFVALGNSNVQVTAIDLSRRSLAYAKRKCEDIRIPNIDFAQADILELGSHKQRYDLIESAGVLHHLADPLKGFDILLNLLKPGGKMMIGLYSEIARTAIVAGRGVIAEQNLAPTPDAIRTFRHDVLSNPDTHPARGLIERGDFYNTSTCRDLVFHVQEHRFTLPQIKTILADRGLRFEGFNISPITMNAFRKQNQDQNAEFDLDAWDTFEHKNPKTFYNMYQFWVQKPA